MHRNRRDRARQQEITPEVVALSERQEFVLFLSFGRYSAAIWVVAGDVAGLPESQEALTLMRKTGNQSAEPGILAHVAEAWQGGGPRPVETQAAVAMGLAISAQLGRPFSDAELRRLEGDLVLAAGGAPEEAATRYQQALDIARAQERQVGGVDRRYESGSRRPLSPRCSQLTREPLACRRRQGAGNQQ
jgi:hypothetical protein